MPDVEIELSRRLELGEEVVLATLVRTDGDPPSAAGAKALLDGGRILAGTLGCSEFDSAAQADAAGLLESGQPVLHTYRHDLGSIEVYLEPHLAEPTLLVLADTPVGRALARWAGDMGFRVLSAGGLADLPAELGGDLSVVHTNHDAPDLPDVLARRGPVNPGKAAPCVHGSGPAAWTGGRAGPAGF